MAAPFAEAGVEPEQMIAAGGWKGRLYSTLRLRLFHVRGHRAETEVVDVPRFSSLPRGGACQPLGSDRKAVKKWLELVLLLDQRDEPFIEVAALYPDTLSETRRRRRVSDLYASSFDERVASLRPKLDFDFCSERMIKDGALGRDKVRVFLWSSTVESDVLEVIDRWVHATGGTVIYPVVGQIAAGHCRGRFDGLQFCAVLSGLTGKGRAPMIREDCEPPHRYTDAIVERLRATAGLDPAHRGNAA